MRKSGTWLVLAIVGVAVGVAILRMVCVPVGSFSRGLQRLHWGMPADSVEVVLGPPNQICTDPGIEPAPPDTALGRIGVETRQITVERWVYSRRPPNRPVPTDSSPECGAPMSATELGFDGDHRLRWLVRETGRTAPEVDPGIGLAID